MTTAKIPTRFFTDHIERGLPAPAVARATKTHIFIAAFGPDTDELLSDADHYASDAISAQDFPHLIGLKSSARATAKAIRAARASA